MYYFFKWLVRQWTNSFKSVFNYGSFNNVVDNYLMLWSYSTYLSVYIHILLWMLIGMLLELLLGIPRAFFGGLGMFVLHMIFVYFLIQYKKYQKEKLDKLNMLKNS